MSLDIIEKLQMDLDTRTIYIVDDIDKNTKSRIAICISFLERFDADINIYINSGGGCLVSSLAIFDLIRSCKNVVNGYVVGEACSGASLILQACDNKYISKHSSVMIHYGTHAMPHDIPQNNANLLGYYHSLQEDMLNIYKSTMVYNNRKITDKKLGELLSFDTWFRAKEAIKLGLVDKVKCHPFDVYDYEEDQEISDAELDIILEKLQLGE